jgi:hypothetical protein
VCPIRAGLLTKWTEASRFTGTAPRRKNTESKRLEARTQWDCGSLALYAANLYITDTLALFFFREGLSPDTARGAIPQE